MSARYRQKYLLESFGELRGAKTLMFIGIITQDSYFASKFAPSGYVHSKTSLNVVSHTAHRHTPVNKLRIIATKGDFLHFFINWLYIFDVLTSDLQGGDVTLYYEETT